jgi:hypothetical protein
LLLDPYAKALQGHWEWNPALFGYKMENADDLSFDERDSAPFVPCLARFGQQPRVLHCYDRRAAKFCSRAICLSEKGCTSRR